ncbi:aminotransferase class IV family protein [Neptunicoccus cionae]|uniref:Probable branched-chain-amino-acid aminotransferase n=1 Tax=Neptunicoccus cionae TaxID=2035344 RepID=A0A916VNJ7_9RHOB|nr:aminotransferase class IV family protein [Amylibacter cionae]GGA13513.1 aminotransferase class IV [Amylibacter cionae]
MEGTLRDLAPAGLVVIETLGYSPKDGFARLGLHMDRAEATCARLDIPFDRGEALHSLGTAVDMLPARVRMTIDLDGRIGVSTSELTTPPQVWRVGISDVVLRSDDPWLQVKTSNRAVYDRVRAKMPDDVEELIFLNENGHLCEGTITNLFVGRDGVLLTPPLSSGLLAGVLRQELLDTGRAQEALLTPQDLQGAEIFVGNSLRGLIPAVLV